jgi:hypothetical protein
VGIVWRVGENGMKSNAFEGYENMLRPAGGSANLAALRFASGDVHHSYPCPSSCGTACVAGIFANGTGIILVKNNSASRLPFFVKARHSTKIC